MNELTPIDPQLPAFPEEQLEQLPLSLRIHFDDRIYQRVARIAERMARSTMGTPQHLRGNSDALFEICCRALIWKLDPGMVASATFDANGRFGFEGKLVAAILLNSGRLDGGIEYEHFGDWTRVQGRFKMESYQKEMSGRNGPWTKTITGPVQKWTDEDEVGLGVIARCKLRGEPKPREVSVLLSQCQPRNATTWPTDPMGQICNVAVRRLANRAVPELLFGARFDDEVYASEPIDVTPTDPPPAPEPVDLAVAGIAGTGEMVDEETGEVTEAPAEDEKPKRGRPKLTPEDRLQRCLDDIAEIETVEEANGWDSKDYAKLPADGKRAVDEALASRLAELEQAAPPAAEPAAADPPSSIGAWLGPDRVSQHQNGRSAVDAILTTMQRVETDAEITALLEENSRLIDRAPDDLKTLVADTAKLCREGVAKRGDI